jgi:hypothetical protein
LASRQPVQEPFVVELGQAALARMTDSRRPPYYAARCGFGGDEAVEQDVVCGEDVGAAGDQFRQRLRVIAR